MRRQSPIDGGGPPASGSYLGAMFHLGSILLALLALGYVTARGPVKRPAAVIAAPQNDEHEPPATPVAIGMRHASNKPE